MKIWNAVEFAINKKTLWISCCIHGFPDLSHIAYCDRYDLCLWYLLNIWTMFEYIHKLEFSILFQGSRGGPTLSGEGGGASTFPGGVQLFQWGIHLLISIETHITCDFQGGPDPLSPSRSAHVMILETLNCVQFSCVFGAQKNCPIETVLFNTHSTRVGWGIQ